MEYLFGVGAGVSAVLVFDRAAAAPEAAVGIAGFDFVLAELIGFGEWKAEIGEAITLLDNLGIYQRSVGQVYVAK